MLEIFEQNPSSRVFHVDPECYIVYLGSHWEDYKPFLRLGTSTHLPSELPPITSTIVVPDVLTGNPLDEPANLSGDATPDTHYVGDVKTVRKLKKFLKQDTIPVEAMQRASREVDDNEHVYVYSYKDGNLKIRFRKSEIFDLHRRERQDGHFPARAQSAKNEFGRSPFKLPVDTYQRPGFFVVAGTPYLISRGELAALQLREDYFPELCEAGIDADRVSTVHVESTGKAVLRFFKRSRVKGKTVRVSTPEGEQVAALAGLFINNSVPALKAHVLKGSGGSFTFHRYTVAENPGRVEVMLDGLDGPIVFGKVPRSGAAAIGVDVVARTVTLADGRSRPLLDGCVYQLADEALSRTFITQRYLPEKNYPYRDMLSKDENALIDQIGYFFTELYAGRDAGKVLRTIKSATIARDLGRGVVLNPVTEIVIANTAEYIRYLQAAEPELGKGADGLVSLLEKRELDADAMPRLLPVVAELSRRNGAPFIFYRFAQRITSDRFAHAESVAAKIVAAPLVDHEAERNRLMDLVAGLANPEQMEEARLRRIAERRKPKPAEATAAEESGEGGKGAAAEDGAARGGARPAAGSRGAGTSRRGRSRGPWRWLIPVVVIVLLIAALLALLLTGSIPNPWFGKDDATAAAEGRATDAGEPEEETQAGDGDTVGEDTASGEDTAFGEDTASGEDTAGADGTEDAVTALPEGWPPETLPAVRALQDNPDVTILADRVIGPGGIEITLLDIIALVNRIAADNGYARMDAIDTGRPDPDWIYPGNLFVLPNGTRYTVVQGDTLWAITVRYMVARLQQDYRAYVLLTEEHQAAETSETRRRAIGAELESIGENSHSENFTALVERTLAEWE